MAMSVRLNEDFDIGNLPFLPACFDCGSMPLPNQGACQSRKTAKNCSVAVRLGDFTSQDLVDFANGRLGTFAKPGASHPNSHWE
jgi:hypothetical protein